jgi:hypothetical protein
MDYDAFFIECGGKRLAPETLLPNGTAVLCHNYHHRPVGQVESLPHMAFDTLENAVRYADTLPGHILVVRESRITSKCVDDMGRNATCTCRCVTLCYAKG